MVILYAPKCGVTFKCNDACSRHYRPQLRICFTKLYFQALEQHKEILNFTKGTIAENAPIIPISGKFPFS